MQTFRVFFCLLFNKHASWRLLENTNIQCRWQTSFRGDLGMFLRVCGFWTGNKISISIPLWNSKSPPCEETSGYSPGVRKQKQMIKKQKQSKPVMSPGWQLTFANKKSKNPSSDSLMTKFRVYPGRTGSTNRLINHFHKNNLQTGRKTGRIWEYEQGCERMHGGRKIS